MLPGFRIKQTDGSALLTVVVTIAVFAVLTTALLEVSTFNKREAVFQEQKTKARGLAEAGAARTLKDWDKVNTMGEVYLDEGKYWAKVTPDPMDTDYYTIEAYGQSGVAGANQQEARINARVKGSFNLTAMDKVILAGENFKAVGNNVNRAVDEVSLHANGTLDISETNWAGQKKLDNLSYSDQLISNGHGPEEVLPEEKTPFPVIVPEGALTKVDMMSDSELPNYLSREGDNYTLNVSMLSEGKYMLEFPEDLYIVGNSKDGVYGVFQAGGNIKVGGSGDDFSLGYGPIEDKGPPKEEKYCPIVLISQKGDIELEGKGAKAGIFGIIYSREGNVTIIGGTGTGLSIRGLVYAAQDVTVEGHVDLGLLSKGKGNGSGQEGGGDGSALEDFADILKESDLILTEPKIESWQETYTTN